MVTLDACHMHAKYPYTVQTTLNSVDLYHVRASSMAVLMCACAVWNNNYHINFNTWHT